MIKEIYSIQNADFVQDDMETMPPGRSEPADIVAMFDLLYNFKDPIGVLRRARELTKQVLLIETQTTILDLDGRIDFRTPRQYEPHAWIFRRDRRQPREYRRQRIRYRSVPEP